MIGPLVQHKKHPYDIVSMALRLKSQKSVSSRFILTSNFLLDFDIHLY